MGKHNIWGLVPRTLSREEHHACIFSAVSDLAHVPLVLGVFHIEDRLRNLIRCPPLPIRRLQLVQIAGRLVKA